MSFLVICTDLAYFYAWLTSFSNLLIHFWMDLQMAPIVELRVDGLIYKGFAQVLYDVLKELGVPTEQVKYVYHGKPGPDGL